MTGHEKTLVQNGVQGLYFSTMNRARSVDAVLANLRLQDLIS